MQIEFDRKMYVVEYVSLVELCPYLILGNVGIVVIVAFVEEFPEIPYRSMFEFLSFEVIAISVDDFDDDGDDDDVNDAFSCAHVRHEVDPAENSNFPKIQDMFLCLK